jgi:pimeloyl-ACP methyl ester carboxylesterase
MAYHFVDAVGDVLALADALAWERFALIGHSMGAGIASLVPGAAPRRVTHLVVVDGLGPLSAPAAEAPANLARALAADRRARPPRCFPDLATAVAARQGGSDLSAAAAQLLVERAVEVGPDGVRFRHDPRLQRPSRLRLTEEQVLAFLAAVDCPTLAVRASAGLELFAELITARLGAIPDVTVVEVAGGHHLHLDNPEGVAAAVRPFLLAPTLSASA